MRHVAEGARSSKPLACLSGASSPCVPGCVPGCAPGGNPRISLNEEDLQVHVHVGSEAEYYESQGQIEDASIRTSR